MAPIHMAFLIYMFKLEDLEVNVCCFDVLCPFFPMIALCLLNYCINCQYISVYRKSNQLVSNNFESIGSVEWLNHYNAL